MLVPDSLKITDKLQTPHFLIRKLMAKDVYLDYIAVMSSIDIIKNTRGGDWPTKDLTFEDDLIDLAWHQREFENRHSFAYTVMDLEGTECLGCIYFYPPGTRKKAPENSDVDISFWVTAKAYREGLYEILYKEILEWLDQDWLFKYP